MNVKITPAQLDEIEATAKERVQREWFEPGRSFEPEVVLALVAEVRELRAKVERATTIARRFDKRDPMWRDMHYAAKVMRALEEEA